MTVSNALVGFIEIKAPDKGADPRRFSDPHDKAQWGRLKALPNILYTSGNSFSLWQDGELQGRVVDLDGDVETSGARLKAPDTLLPMIESFLTWNPIPPKSAKQLATISARLCRLLRDEVVEEMRFGSVGLTGLAEDWRKLLFPDATDERFADGYAQAVTFGLLVARARGISLDGGIETAARELKKSNSLIGTALGLLTNDDANEVDLSTSLGALTRVLGAVSWTEIVKASGDGGDAWLYFYEDFLEVYDNALRKKTGSYYTPPQVVDAMVRLVDECLRGPLFDRPLGLASADVTVADPAVGTGTFLLGVLRRIAGSVRDDQGAGAVPAAIAAATRRVVGFELQFGPFAVAQLRLIAEVQALMKTKADPTPGIPELQLFITDTLGNPYVEEQSLGQLYEPVAKSRRAANRIKREQPITVVIGNPPYKEKAEGRGGWVEKGTTSSDALKPPLHWWQPPATWGVGAHTKHLRNLYVYFWRWASWKVFGSGFTASTGLPETDRAGIVCFITVAGFLNGPGFQRMRDDLRRSCSEIWVIDCSPEGHQPEVATRVFQGVQQPICIVLAARAPGKAADEPARLHFRSLPKGRREEKFLALAALSTEGAGWQPGPSRWRDAFFPAPEGTWAGFPMLRALFDFAGPGVMPGRTWALAPDEQTLQARWKKLESTKDPSTKERLFHPQLRHGAVASRHIRKVVSQNLGGILTRSVPVIADRENCPQIVQYAFRSFDRQKIIADARLLNDPRPQLWAAYSERQVFITALEASSPSNGPGLSLTNLIPDQDHYKGSFGGRVYPLWRDAAATQSNMRPALLTALADTYGHEVGAEDLFAYIAALLAHPAFTARFHEDLILPGLRVPLTTDGALFARAVSLGREIVWLHCYGERFAHPAAGRLKAAPRLPPGERPTVPADGAIPGAPEPLPDVMSYDPGTSELHIGAGRISKVTPAMWAYEVSGKTILRQWFGYRRLDRSKPIIGDRRPPSPLDKIQPEHWPAEYTSDLLDLLNVLGRLIKLEPAQAELLDCICAGKLISAQALRDADAIPPRPGEEGA